MRTILHKGSFRVKSARLRKRHLTESGFAVNIPTVFHQKGNQLAKGVYIATFGCQMNKYDSEKMMEILAPDYLPVSEPEEADLILVNSCSVREKAEQKLYTAIGRYMPLKKQRPGLIIGAAGCVAQQIKEKVFERFPQLDICIGTDAIQSIRSMVEEVEKKRIRVQDTAFRSGGYHIDETEAPFPALVEGFIPTTFVAIQKGCDHFCSYCIVPFTRGREKSRPVEEITAECRRMVESGVREITLLGQNVNSYGNDLPGVDFADLLHAVNEIDGLLRIRFVTSHAASLNERQMSAMAGLPKVCEYLHLPIQSGSDRILHLMNRGYTSSEYMGKLSRLREYLPNVSLSGDMIVGFPQETEEDFQRTLEVMREIRYETLFAFAYSPRPLTKASKLIDDVPREVKLERLGRLLELQKEITREANRAYTGKTVEVLVDGPARRDNEMQGRTRSNKIVNFPGSPDMVGRLIEVRIVAAYQNSLKGRLLSEED